MQSLAGLALAFSGQAVHEQAKAETLAEDLAKHFPEDTVVQFNYLPTIRARLALSRNGPSKALDALEAANPYELGLPPSPAFSHTLCPVDVRGQSLSGHQIRAASRGRVSEDSRLSRGCVQRTHWRAGHLGLARAYGLSDDTAKARIKYQDFFALWKDADADIPILKKAKTDYAKLQ